MQNVAISTCRGDRKRMSAQIEARQCEKARRDPAELRLAHYAVQHFLKDAITERDCLLFKQRRQRLAMRRIRASRKVHPYAGVRNDHAALSASLRPAHRVRVAFPMHFPPKREDVAIGLLPRKKPPRPFHRGSLGLEASRFHCLGEKPFTNVDVRAQAFAADV